MLIVVVNGHPESGKDTFVRFCWNELTVTNLIKVYEYDSVGNIIKEENYDEDRLFYETFIGESGNVVAQRDYDEDERLIHEEIEQDNIDLDWR